MLHVPSAIEGTAPPPVPLHVALAKTTAAAQEATYTFIHTAIRKEWVSNPVESLAKTSYADIPLLFLQKWKICRIFHCDYLEIVTVHVTDSLAAAGWASNSLQP